MRREKATDLELGTKILIVRGVEIGWRVRTGVNGGVNCGRNLVFPTVTNTIVSGSERESSQAMMQLNREQTQMEEEEEMEGIPLTRGARSQERSHHRRRGHVYRLFKGSVLTKEVRVRPCEIEWKLGVR